MSTQNQNENCMPALGNLVWFEVPADDTARARAFYSGLFGWKAQKFPNMEYWHLDTGGPDATPDGGVIKRQHSGHSGITTYFAVASIDEGLAKVQKLGGSVAMPKTPVPGMGWFALCHDPEKNMFGLWQHDPSAPPKST